METSDYSMSASLRNSVNISQPTDFRSSVNLRSGLTISQPMDFRASTNLSVPVSPGAGQGHGFGSAAQRSSIRILHLSLSDQAPEGNSSIVETKLGDI